MKIPIHLLTLLLLIAPLSCTNVKPLLQPEENNNPPGPKPARFHVMENLSGGTKVEEEKSLRQQRSLYLLPIRGNEDNYDHPEYSSVDSPKFAWKVQHKTATSGQNVPVNDST